MLRHDDENKRLPSSAIEWIAYSIGSCERHVNWHRFLPDAEALVAELAKHKIGLVILDNADANS